MKIDEKYETYSTFLDLIDKTTNNKNGISMASLWISTFEYPNHHLHKVFGKTFLSIWNSSGIELLSHSRKYYDIKNVDNFNGIFYWLCKYKIGMSNDDILRGMIETYE